MGLSKSSLFTEEQNRLATSLKALAHPARIAIVQQLIRENTCICGDLVTDTGLAQATVSQHLKALKSVGWLRANGEGVKVCYCIDPGNWNGFRQELEAFLTSYEGKNTCC